MNLKKRWYLILSKPDSAGSYCFSVNSAVFSVGAILLVAFVIFITTLSFYNIKNQTERTHLENYRRENELLKENITRIYTEIDSIVNKLNQMEEWENQLRLEKNLEIIDQDLRKMGTGGMPLLNEIYFQFDKDTNVDFHTIDNFVNQLRLRVNYSYLSRQDLSENLAIQSDIYRYTPSIYPTYGRISTPFGWRTHPITRARDFHNGIDISNATGTPIYVTADGRVTEVSYNRFIGNYIVVRHGYGYATKYGHLNKSLVKVGDEVRKGEIIAEMGNSGRSTGPHLHYEVTRYNRLINPYHTLNKMAEDINIAQN